MHTTAATTTRTATTHRSPQAKLSPYFMDEIGLTRTDVLRTRAADTAAPSGT